MASSTFPVQVIERLTPSELRESGADKWTRFPDCIGAFIAEMDYGCPQPVSAAMHAVVAAGSLGYLSVEHVRDLADATVKYLGQQYSWKVQPEWVRPLADIVQAFQVFLQHFVKPGGTIIVPTPAYMPFISMPELVGVNVIEVPMLREVGEWRLDFDAIAAAFAQGADALVLCHPHNPIGKVYSVGELQQLCELVEQAGALVFSDEIHAPILLSTDKVHIPYASISPAAAAHSMTAISASKAFNIPGTKCCQIVFTSEQHRDMWQRMGNWYEHQTSILGVYATIAAYERGAEWLAGALEYLRENMRLCVETIRACVPAAKLIEPEASYLLWVDIRETEMWLTRTSNNAATELRERSNIAVTDGRECGEIGEGHIRFNTAMPRPILEAALRELVEGLRSGERLSP